MALVGETYVTQLAKNANCTYAHCANILKKFFKLGLVEYHIEGRIKKVNLTDSGKELYKIVGDLNAVLLARRT